MRALLLTALCLTAAACGPTREERAQSVISNPAGQNCIQRGGKLIIRQSSQGQKGYCMLTDGRTLDIWEYMRQTNP